MLSKRSAELAQRLSESDLAVTNSVPDMFAARRFIRMRKQLERPDRMFEEELSKQENDPQRWTG